MAVFKGINKAWATSQPKREKKEYWETKWKVSQRLRKWNSEQLCWWKMHNSIYQWLYYIKIALKRQVEKSVPRVGNSPPVFGAVLSACHSLIVNSHLPMISKMLQVTPPFIVSCFPPPGWQWTTALGCWRHWKLRCLQVEPFHSDAQPPLGDRVQPSGKHWSLWSVLFVPVSWGFLAPTAEMFSPLLVTVPHWTPAMLISLLTL